MSNFKFTFMAVGLTIIGFCVLIVFEMAVFKLVGLI